MSSNESKNVDFILCKLAQRIRQDNKKASGTEGRRYNVRQMSKWRNCFRLFFNYFFAVLHFKVNDTVLCLRLGRLASCRSALIARVGTKTCGRLFSKDTLVLTLITYNVVLMYLYVNITYMLIFP